MAQAISTNTARKPRYLPHQIPNMPRPVDVVKIVSPHSRTAEILLRAIKSDLGDVGFFTREDLIHLPVLSHVATITRYMIVCRAVDTLIAGGYVVAKSRTDLCLPGKSKQYVHATLSSQYITTVRKIVKSIPPKTRITVMSVVENWKMDQHLTENNKRVAVREVLKDLTRRGEIKPGNYYDYVVVKVAEKSISAAGKPGT
jgi:hypothetical protein